MSVSPNHILHFFEARLSRRIVLWVFASIVVIEGIILIPSVYRRERELLDYLQTISMAEANGVLRQRSLDWNNPQQVFSELRTLEEGPLVLGGALYDDQGKLIGQFGEAPQLTLEDIVAHGERSPQQRLTYLDRNTRRYDALWRMSPLEGQYSLIIRHDTTQVQQEIYAFIWRIAGLVLIISVFVTGATMIVLEQLLISPILRLRQDVLRAGEAIRQDQPLPSLASAGDRRNHELGDVIATFDMMVQQVAAAIAERKQAEAALRFSEEKFAKAFRSSPNPILLSTLADGRLIEVNDSFLQFLGTTIDKILGCTALELNIWSNAGDRQSLVQSLQQDQVVRNQECQLRTQTGQLRTVLYSAEWIDINGTDCMLSVINDISDRKQAEEALRESEQRFRSLVEQAADAFLVVDFEGNITDVNQQACRNLGYTRDELLSLSVSDIQIGVSLEHLKSLWQQLTPVHPITVEGIHRRKDGSTFPVEVRLGLFEFGDRPLVAGLARDITERKQAEAALARLAEIGELTAMIVHEVRNPLTTVLMGLQSFVGTDLSERSQLRLQLALEESDRLQRLLNEILLYAREQRLHLEPIDIIPFVEEVIDTLRSLPINQDRVLHLESERRDLQIMGDRDKLKQVLINIVNNACEAVPEKDLVTCTITSHLHRNRPEICISVHNRGTPIPPDILPKLTQPFFTTKSSGNGLGLAITKRIVEAHQGTLAITSSLEEGTTVSISLPAVIN